MTDLQNTELREFLTVEAALADWRQNRLFAAVGCGEAERQAFAAGYRAGVEFNAVRVLDDDETETALQRFRRLDHDTANT